jgi:hypothetical protein
MKLVFWAGIIFFLGAIALIVYNYENIKVETKGAIVKMRIEKLPSSCLGTRIKHFTTLSYNGEDYIKRIGGKFCDEHHVGEFIDVKFLEGSSTVLFPNESVMSNLLAFGVLGLIGAGMSLSQWKKIKNEK